MVETTGVLELPQLSSTPSFWLRDSGWITQDSLSRFPTTSDLRKWTVTLQRGL